jgi:hypothetical protein
VADLYCRLGGYPNTRNAIYGGAISATSAGKPVRSAAQSRKVERKPCVVSSPLHIPRKVISSAMLLSRKTRSSAPVLGMALRSATAGSQSGTRCSLSAFMRSGGMVSHPPPFLIFQCLREKLFAGSIKPSTKRRGQQRSFMDGSGEFGRSGSQDDSNARRMQQT